MEDWSTRFLKRESGFTFIEVVIVVVILSVVSLISISFVISSTKLYVMTNNQKTLFDEGKLALERMCRDIRDANSIASPAASSQGGLIRFSRTNVTALDGADEVIQFQLTGSALEKVKNYPAGPTSSLAGSVSGFTVTRDSGNEIRLYLQLQMTSRETVTLQTKVYPKNPAKDATYKNFYRNWKEDVSS